MIKEISEFILDRVSIAYWERDVNFFVGSMPETNKNRDKVEVIPRIAVILENTPADVTGYLVDRMDKPIQILNRHKSFFLAREDAYRFYWALHGATGFDLPIISSGKEWTAMIVDAMGSPVPIENPDEKNRYVFSTNYMWRIQSNL